MNVHQIGINILVQKEKSTISENITNIFKDGELQKDSVVREFRTTAEHSKPMIE